MNSTAPPSTQPMQSDRIGPQVWKTASARDDSILRDALVTGVCLGLPGVSLAIATKEGVVFSGTDGYSDLGKSLPLQVNDRFCVGSITKTFVAVVTLQLVEEGKIDLASTAMDYVGRLACGEYVGEVPNADKATIRQLLSHQSGVPTWEFQPDWIKAGRGENMVPGHVFEKVETLKYCTRGLLPPTGAPGEKFSYSNTNYTLLGLIIEAVTENDAAHEIRARIIEPLGLRHTFLESFEDPAVVCDEGGRALCNHYHYATPAFLDSAGYSSEIFGAASSESGSGLHRYLIDSSKANLSPEWCAGGMAMRAEDLAIYTRALRDGTLLSADMRREMFTYYPPSSDEIGDDSSGTGTRTDNKVPRPRLSQLGSYYCQGIQRSESTGPPGLGLGPSYGHGGGTLGFSSRMLWLDRSGESYSSTSQAGANEGSDTSVDCVIACMANVGSMHSGLDGLSPFGVFTSQVLLPAVKQYLGIPSYSTAIDESSPRL